MSETRERGGLRTGLCVAMGVLFLDQLIKYLILQQPLPPQGLEMGPFLRLVRVWNQGVNFGLFGSDSPLQAYLLAALAAVAGLAILFWTSRSGSFWQCLSGALLAGGAWGNGLDRLFFLAVQDYLNVSCCGWHNPYAFNFADSAIAVGVVGIILSSLGGRPAKRQT